MDNEMNEMMEVCEDIGRLVDEFNRKVLIIDEQIKQAESRKSKSQLSQFKRWLENMRDDFIQFLE